MERGSWPAKSLHRDLVRLTAGALGGGAAVMTNELTTGTWQLSAGDNFYLSNTRTSQGLFVVTLKEMPPLILSVEVEVYNETGTVLTGSCRTFSTALKQVTIDIRDGGSAVADPTTSDHVRVIVTGRESTS